MPSVVFKIHVRGRDDEDDGNTPYNILDVRVVAVTDSSVTLTWTATGDDADVGTASQYDLPITTVGLTRRIGTAPCA